MSSTAYVVGIIPADDKYRLMLEIQKNCKAALVEVPREVSEFFENVDEPCELGAEVQLGILGCGGHDHPCVTQFAGPYASGIEIAVEKLPNKIKFLRFLVS